MKFNQSQNPEGFQFESGRRDFFDIRKIYKAITTLKLSFGKKMGKIKDSLWKILGIIGDLEMTYIDEEFMKGLIEGDNYSVLLKNYAKRELPNIKEEREELKDIYHGLIGKRYYHVGNIKRQLRFVNFFSKI